MRLNKKRILPIKLYNESKKEICIVLVDFDENNNKYIGKILCGNLNQRIKHYSETIIYECDNFYRSIDTMLNKANDLIKQGYKDIDNDDFPNDIREKIVDGWVNTSSFNNNAQKQQK